MGWLQIVLALLQMAPGILQAIQGAETALPGPKLGPVKKAIVLAPVTASPAPPEMISAVGQMIDSLVAAKNAAPKP